MNIFDDDVTKPGQKPPWDPQDPEGPEDQDDEEPADDDEPDDDDSDFDDDDSDESSPLDKPLDRIRGGWALLICLG